MVGTDELERIVDHTFNKTLAEWEDNHRTDKGSIRDVLDPSEFNYSCGIGFFSSNYLSDEDVLTFTNRIKMISNDNYKKVVDYLGQKTDAEYPLKLTEFKRIIITILKKVTKSINKTNFQVLQNNLTYKDYSKRFYGYVNALKVTKDSEDVEYNPKIIINKSQSLVDVEKVKAQCYDEIEKNNYFKTNNELFEKKKESE